MHGHTVALILHHPQCSFSDWPHTVHLGPAATTFTIMEKKPSYTTSNFTFVFENMSCIVPACAVPRHKGAQAFLSGVFARNFFSCGLHRQPQQCLWTKRLLDRRHRGCFPEKYELASATNVFQLLPKLTRESAIWTSSSRKVSFLPTWLESSIRFHPTAFYELCSVNQDDLGFGGFFWRCKPASLKKRRILRKSAWLGTCVKCVFF